MSSSSSEYSDTDSNSSEETYQQRKIAKRKNSNENSKDILLNDFFGIEDLKSSITENINNASKNIMKEVFKLVDILEDAEKITDDILLKWMKNFEDLRNKIDDLFGNFENFFFEEFNKLEKFKEKIIEENISWKKNNERLIIEQNQTIKKIEEINRKIQKGLKEKIEEKNYDSILKFYEEETLKKEKIMEDFKQKVSFFEQKNFFLNKYVSKSLKSVEKSVATESLDPYLCLSLQKIFLNFVKCRVWISSKKAARSLKKGNPIIPDFKSRTEFIACQQKVGYSIKSEENFHFERPKNGKFFKKLKKFRFLL